MIGSGAHVRRRIRLTVSRCQHLVGPVVVEREKRGRIGRCLECGTVGPVRETVEEAYQDLRYFKLRCPGRNAKAPRRFRR